MSIALASFHAPPVAVITGASRGLGAQFARSFHEAGYSLCLIARSMGDLEALKTDIETARKKTSHARQTIVCLAADIGNSTVLQDLSPRLDAACQRVDVLINNAAIQGPIGPLQDNDWQAWQETLAINLLAPVFLTKTVLPKMMAQKSGTIIMLSGGGATGPRANFTAYASAKTALVRFAETLAEELRPLKDQGIDITVNAIAPGAMATAMLREVLTKGAVASGTREHAIAQKIMDTGGTSMAHVAELAVFLTTPKARVISGKLISAPWDRWSDWPAHAEALTKSDVYTLRRITGRDRGFDWGDV